MILAPIFAPIFAYENQKYKDVRHHKIVLIIAV